jgi:antitoxin component YwqK of YwqJK toxin-antitoxin module
MRFIFVFLVLSTFFTACSPTEKTETRDAEGYLERFERRKKDFAKEGLYQKFSPNGTLIVEAHYQNDTLHGERKFFYPNGTMESTEYYVRGNYHGPYRKYYQDGQLELEQNFVNGSMQGLSLKYYPNGQLAEKVSVVDSDDNGPFWEYYENGKLKAEGFYVPTEDGESVENGELKEYDEQGQLIRIAMCHNGMCNTTWKK